MAGIELLRLSTWLLFPLTKQLVRCLKISKHLSLITHFIKMEKKIYYHLLVGCLHEPKRKVFLKEIRRKEIQAYWLREITRILTITKMFRQNSNS